MLGIYWDNGKEHGIYYLEFSVVRLNSLDRYNTKSVICLRPRCKYGL